MDRRAILELAGAVVYAEEYFGSYQGDYLALTDKGWVRDYYGSCSGCDWVEAVELNYPAYSCQEHRWSPDRDCPACLKYLRAQAKWESRTRDIFYEEGVRLLEGALTTEELCAKLSENAEWDSSVKEMLDFVRAQGS